MGLYISEKLVKFYRVLFSRYIRGGQRSFLKDFIYKIAFFFAKKRASLLFFYSEKEKQFESFDLNKQYQIFLNNNSLVGNEQFNESLKDIKNEPKIGIVLSVEKISVELLTKIIKSIINQNYKNYELTIICDKSEITNIKSNIIKFNLSNFEIITKENNENKQKVYNKIISNTKNDYIIFLEKNVVLLPYTLSYIMKEISLNQDLDIIYSDEDVIDKENQRIQPFFKPEWSPQLLFSHNYLGELVTYSVRFLKSLNGFNENIEKGFEYDLFLRAIEKNPKVLRLPTILFSSTETSKEKYKEKLEFDKICLEDNLKKNNINAEIITIQDRFFSIRLKVSDKQPLLSLIIPTKNNKSLLEKCIKSIQKSTYQNYEIIIVNNGKKIEKKSLFGNSKLRILDYKEQFNFSAINNFAAKQAKGDYLLFLNDDTEVINENWIEFMLFYATQKNVGVVGSLLLYPKSKLYPLTIQHGGVSLGVVGPSVHSFSFSHYGMKNYFNFDKMSRNVSAVTAACMMVNAEIFKQIGGFDETFEVAFGDIDLCLRIKQKGYQIVYCPNTKLYHAESSSRGTRSPLNDEINLLNRWEDSIISGDDFYNPNLTHLNRNFRIAPHPSKIPAISILKEIIYLRDDLEKRFSKTSNNLGEQIDWAATEGVTSDMARTAILSYNKFYVENCTASVKKLAEAIYHFNHSSELQDKFTEVFSGKYDNLLSYFNALGQQP